MLAVALLILQNEMNIKAYETNMKQWKNHMSLYEHIYKAWKQKHSNKHLNINMWW